MIGLISDVINILTLQKPVIKCKMKFEGDETFELLF